MEISKYKQYAITNRNPETRGRFITVATTPAAMSGLFSENTIRIDEIHDYEIYTNNPETGQSGWAIHLVRSTDHLISKYPHFDCIITRNDCSPNVEFIDFDNVHNEYFKIKRLDKPK